MEEEISKSKKLNIVPLFGDLATLVIGLFILIIVVQISQLENITTPDEIPVSNYFSSGSFKLTKEDSSSLVSIIKENYFKKIKKSFVENTLVSIRIEGHTDSDKVMYKKGRFATNNKQLSFMRAEKVAQIFENIIKDSFSSKDDQKELVRKIRIIGHGSTHDKYGFKKVKNSIENENIWAVYEKKANNVDSIIVEFKSFGKDEITAKKKAEEESKRKLRRVEIVLVVKGIPKA